MIEMTDIVVGHGPHCSLPLEAHKGRPIFYGLGSFSFHTGHGGLKHGSWLGMMVRVSCASGYIESVAFQFVPHDDHNRTVHRALADEETAFDQIVQERAGFGVRLETRGDEVCVDLRT